ncbi:uncharacterized protein OCT59_028403 [Rhizophagus irregularis]|uniref:uncharacterized protein n=1 Tax=Rhizophagus irregularis TaxID=588596 RepID=UPI003316E7B1|nr:hypothetical protein OCT59_028403 [Rhizophagus irregularis]
MEYMEDEYLTNSYSLVIKVFDNGSEGFYNTEDIFENYNSNRTVDPNFTLLNVDSPINENILDFSDDNSETLNSSLIYQYNLYVGDIFDNWQSVDAFMHQYCLERRFGYQNFQNDKDSTNSLIIWHKSFQCLLVYINTRYRCFNSDNMIQDLKFFTDCKVTPVVQLEILRKKYPEHVFYKQDVCNAIYYLQKDKDESLDSSTFTGQNQCYRVHRTPNNTNTTHI